MSFFERLFGIISFFLNVGIKRLLAGAGLGLFTGSIFVVVFNYYVGEFVGVFSSVQNDYIGLLGLMGIDNAVNIIIGAYAVRLGLLAVTKISIGKVG